MDFVSAILGAGVMYVVINAYQLGRRRGAISDFADERVKRGLLVAIRRADHDPRADISEALQRSSRWN